MKMPKVHLFSFLLLLFIYSVSALHSQPLFLKQKSGPFTNYPSTAITKISFTNSDIVVSTINEAVNVSLLDFQYISFVNFVASISRLKTENKLMQLFPSAVNDFLTVKINSTTNERVSVKVMSIDGKLIANQNFENGETTFKIDVSSLPKGIYLCYASTSSFNEMSKFIKN